MFPVLINYEKNVIKKTCQISPIESTLFLNVLHYNITIRVGQIAYIARTHSLSSGNVGK